MRIWPADWPSGAPDLTNIVPWTAPNRPIHRSLGRRGINPSQKALKMPFWVADVNGDLFWPKDFGIMTTKVQLCLRRRGMNRSQKAVKMPFWVADVNGDLFRPRGFRNHDNTRVIVMVQSTEHPNLPQPGAKRNESESKSTENAILGSRCQRRSLPAPRIPQSTQHTGNCRTCASSGAPNCEIRRSPGRRGINRGQKALKMPFWVADVNGDLFWPQGFRNHDNTGVIVVRGDHLEHRTPKSAAVWGEEE
ncbi:hypothetical protein R3P38DRAFT_2779660 [Favolaschia claudopus]|uniref:Uncharacterized protein n=1 Tax=Favolaschia claudopus TaxID=2862362 RepID=A0AAW0BDE2_9AGAR